MLDAGGPPSIYDEEPRVIVHCEKSTKMDSTRSGSPSREEKAKEVLDTCICKDCMKNDVCIFVSDVQLLMARFNEVKSDINLDDRFGYTISCKSCVKKSSTGIGIR